MVHHKLLLGYHTVFILTLALATTACHNSNSIEDIYEQVVIDAGKNSFELKKTLDHYNDNRREIAKYLVAGIGGRFSRTGRGMDSIEVLYRELPGANKWDFDSAQLARAKRYVNTPLSTTKDASIITADYLIENIDDAWRLWKSRLWNQDLPQRLMCEMLLPYRIGDEPLTRWRKPYREWLSELEDSLEKCNSSVHAARLIVNKIGVCPYQEGITTPHRSAINLLKTPIGYCREDCDRTIYAMRSMGIPVAVDKMLVSPDNGSSHMWTVVWDNVDHKTRMFDNEHYPPTRDSIYYDNRRKGKIYRKTFFPDLDRLSRYSKAVNPPKTLINSRLKDVTSEYFGHNHAEVDIWPEAHASEENAVYLGVFGKQQFQPVDIATFRDNKAIFTDIEPNLIYAPILADGRICGYPFMLENNGNIHTFIPNENYLESLTLTRKFPIRFHIRHHLASVVGLHVQSGPTDHGPWTDLEIISSPPTCIYHRIEINSRLKDSYIRLTKSNGIKPEIAMILACRDTLGLDCIPISVVGDEVTRKRYESLIQNDITRCNNIEIGADNCIFHIDSHNQVRALFLVPQNDDNFVMPNQTYELLFFSGKHGWKSLGRKTAKNFSIDFQAPKGALLWLRNLTKGHEEQIFIWKQNKQLFNIDLYKNFN